MFKSEEIEMLVERYPLLAGIEDNVYSSYQLIEKSYRKGGKLLIAGNGGGFLVFYVQPEN